MGRHASIWLELEMLTSLSTPNGLSVQDVRTYAALSVRSLQSKSAQEFADIGQAMALCRSLRLPEGCDSRDARRRLREPLLRLQRRGLIEQDVPSADWEAAVAGMAADERRRYEGKPERRDEIIRLSRMNGSSHARRIPVRGGGAETTKYVWLLQEFVRGPMEKLSDPELVLLLLLYSGARLNAFGGVDQEMVSVHGDRIVFGSTIDSIYQAVERRSQTGVRWKAEVWRPEVVLRQLIARGFFAWHALNMFKATTFGNAVLLAYPWLERTSPGSKRKITKVLVPTRGLSLGQSAVSFINSLARGEITEGELHETTIELLKGMVNSEDTEYEDS